MNLFCGCLSVVYVFQGNIPVFAMLTAASLVFDFFDGFAARAFKSNSALGKELDSLADMVSFGLVPGAIMYHLFELSVPLSLHTGSRLAEWIGVFPFIITIFAALRLARFNIDTRQTHSFLGMPTPAVTIFVVGLALIIQYDRFHLTPRLLNSYVIGGISMVLSWLLVSEIPLFSLKFKSFDWKSNQSQYLLLILSALLLFFLHFTAIPLIIIFYLILSLLENRGTAHSESP